jgi:hypothetical protein
MEPECSLPYSQKPVIGTYPVFDEFSSHVYYLFKINFNSILPSTSLFQMEFFH